MGETLTNLTSVPVNMNCDSDMHQLRNVALSRYLRGEGYTVDTRPYPALISLSQPLQVSRFFAHIPQLNDGFQIVTARVVARSLTVHLGVKFLFDIVVSCAGTGSKHGRGHVCSG